MKWHTLAGTIFLFASVISCTSVATPLPSSTVIAFPTATALPTVTSTPTLTPTPTLPPIAATAWASDTSGKVNPQTMYPLVGAINYKHRKTIDLVYGNVFLAVITDQDLTKVSADEQRNLRSKLAVSLNQSQESQKLLSQISTGLARSNAGGTKLTIIIEGGKPTQAIAQQTDTARYSIDSNGTLTKLDARYQLLPALGLKGKDIVRADTNEVIRLKGFDMMSTLTGLVEERQRGYAGESVRTPQYIDIAKKLGANVLRIEYTGALVNKYSGDIKKIVEQAERNGMYVIFTAASLNGSHADLYSPNDELIDTEVALAKMLHPYSNVILDVYNEPHGDTSKQQYSEDNQILRTSMENAVTRIVNEGKFNGLIMIPGNEWGKDMKYAADSQLLMSSSNIIYRFNLSCSIGDKKYQTQEIIDRQFVRQTALVDSFLPTGKPIFIGEFVLVENEMKQGPLEKSWQEKALEYIRRNELHYTQWQLNYYGKGGLLIGTNPKDYKLSQGGEIIFGDLQANPPTQFDK